MTRLRISSVLSPLVLVVACTSSTEVVPPPAAPETGGTILVPASDDGGGGVGFPARGGDGQAPAKAEPLADDPMKVTIRRLANGLTLMLSENHEDPRIEAWITVRAGSAKDPADATGMAHYLEHMNFKGTSRLGTVDWEKEKPHLDAITALYDELFVTTDPAKRSEIYAKIDRENQEAAKYAVPNEFDGMYDALGFQGLNAFTTDDQTSYTVSLPSNRLAQWAEVEAERFRDPVYRLFQTEIEAVYEEKNRGMDSKPRFTHEATLLGLWPQHPYGTQPTLGTVEHLKNPSITKMYEFFRTWYVPGNMVVALSGDFDTEPTLELLAKHFGTWVAREFPADPKFPMPAPQGVRTVEIEFEGEEEVRLAWQLVPATHPDRDALALADMMLDNQQTGLVNVNLMQAQRVLTAGATRSFEVDGGYELMFAIPKPGQTVEEAEDLLLEQVALLKKGAFTQADLDATITDFEIDEKRGLESNRTRVTVMTSAFIHQEPWERRVAELERLRRITKDEVAHVANKYFGSNYVRVVRRNGHPTLPKIPKPTFTPVKIDTSRRSAYFHDVVAREVEPLDPRFLEEGRDYVKTDLRSGRLVSVRNPLNDLFQVSFAFEVGTDHDPRLGTALTLLDLAGAGDLDPVAYKRHLYALGSTISAGAGRQETVVTVTGVEKNLEATLGLLRDHFARPVGVTQAELDQLVARIVKSRGDQKQNPPAVNAALVAYAAQGDQSDFLRQPTNEQLQALKVEDLVQAIKSLWSHRRIVQYAGTRSPADAAKLLDLDPFVGGWESLRDGQPYQPIEYVTTERPRILFVDRKTAQAQVALLIPDGSFDRTVVPLHRLYNEYMSGSMGSLVFQEIRESRALAYTAYTVYRTAQRKEDANVMMGVLGTQNDKTPDAVQVLLSLLRDMPAQPERFTTAQRTIDQAYRAGRLSFRQIPGVIVTWDRQQLEGDPRPWNWERVREAKMDDLVKFASRFTDRPYTLAVLGDKSKIDMGKLAEYGTVTELSADQLFVW